MLFKKSETLRNEKGKVVRKKKIGDLCWVWVYLNDDALPYQFLVPDSTPDHELVEAAKKLREYQERFGLA